VSVPAVVRATSIRVINIRVINAHVTNIKAINIWVIGIRLWLPTLPPGHFWRAAAADAAAAW
jgi:hypothetical protein